MKRTLLMLAITFASIGLSAQGRTIVVYHQARTVPVFYIAPAAAKVTMTPLKPTNVGQGEGLWIAKDSASYANMLKQQQAIQNRMASRDLMLLPEIPNQAYPTSYFRPYNPPAKPVTTTTTTTITVTTKSY